MKKIKYSVLFILICFFVSIYLLNNHFLFPNESRMDSKDSIKSYADPIITISDNSGFSAYPGYGNSTHPYIIENKIIDGSWNSDCISITDTTAYFIIRYCIIYNGKYGISLDNVTNGKLLNNTCHSHQYSGFLLYDAYDNILINNTAYNNTEKGIWLFDVDNQCNNNTLIKNQFYENQIGIEIFQGGKFNNLTKNIARNNSQIGLYLHIAINTTLIDNIANNNSQGIYLSNSYNNTIFNNTANYNTEHGFDLRDSDDNNLTGNFGCDNSGSGVYLESADNNTIKRNVLHHNALCINETAGCTGNVKLDNNCNIPILSGGSVTPTIGDTSTLFVYSITYTDADNIGPTSIVVKINDIPYQMTKLTHGDNTYTDGCIYVYSTILTASSVHSYCFETIDVITKVNLPSTGANLGPYVSATTSGIPGFTLTFMILGIIMVISLSIKLLLMKKEDIIFSL